MSDRIVLARRQSGREHAVVFDTAGIRVQGGFALRRSLPFRSLDGIERIDSWLWLGGGLSAVGLGGRDVPAERLDEVEAALRERVASLPSGPRQLARIDARPRSQRRLPLLSFAAVAVCGLLDPGEGLAWASFSVLALSLAVGVITEGWLGRRATFVAGAVGGLAAWGVGSPLGSESHLAQGLAAGWLGWLAFARVNRADDLSVLARGAVDLAGVLGVGFAALAASQGVAGPLVAAAAAGFAAAALAFPKKPPPSR